MATRILCTSIFTTKECISSLFFRSYSSLSIKSPSSPLFIFYVSRFRPIAALPLNFTRISSAPSFVRCFATRQTTSSLNDSNPNCSNRPPKKKIPLNGCDFEHWLIVMKKPEGEPTRDEMIDSYIKTLATIVGSDEEARMKIYSVSTRHYYAFGALVSEEDAYKMKELKNVQLVVPDSYLDVKNRDYGGEPFINGQALPYDPKYHEEWVRNNERNRLNDRPQLNAPPRSFETEIGPPAPRAPPNMGGPPAPSAPPNMGGGQAGGSGAPPNMGGGQAGMGGPNQYMGSAPSMGGGQPGMGGPQYMGGGAPPNIGQMTQNNMEGPQNMGGGQPGMGGMPQNNNMGGDASE